MGSLMAAQCFGAAPAHSGGPRARRSCGTTRHLWLGLLHLHVLSLLCFREEPLGGGCILLILAALSSLLSWGCLSVPPRGLSAGRELGSGLHRSWQAAEKLLLSAPGLQRDWGHEPLLLEAGSQQAGLSPRGLPRAECIRQCSSSLEAFVLPACSICPLLLLPPQ